MVDVKPTNAKLIRRSVNLVMLVTGADEATARATLEASQFQVKLAIVAITKHVSAADAQALLDSANGSIRRAIAPRN